MSAIDEQANTIRVFVSDQKSVALNLDNVAKMTVEDLMVHLIGNTGPEECRGRVDVTIYSWAEKGGKHELKGLDFKKQLVSIKKKWSAKADTTYRLLVLGATEKFSPTGAAGVKIDKKARKSEVRSSKRVTSVALRNRDGAKAAAAADGTKSPPMLSPTTLPPPPPIGSVPDVAPNFPPPPPLNNNIPLPPPPPAVPLPPPPPDVSAVKTEKRKSDKASGMMKSKSVRSVRHQSEKPKSRQKVTGGPGTMRGSPSTPVVASGSVTFDPQKKMKANDILEQLNPFVDPSGNYNYEEEPARPDFMLTADDLKAGYYNLNTNNANKLARSEYHQKILMAWVNKHLKEREMKVENLSKDFQNGVILINLLEAISGQQVKTYYREPTRLYQYLENLEVAVKFMNYLGLPIMAAPQDFYHGKLSTVVGFLFVAIQKFKDGKKGNKKAKKVDIEASKHTDASATKVLAEETQGAAPAVSPRPLTRSSPGSPTTIIPPANLPPPPKRDYSDYDEAPSSPPTGAISPPIVSPRGGFQLPPIPASRKGTGPGPLPSPSGGRPKSMQLDRGHINRSEDFMGSTAVPKLPPRVSPRNPPSNLPPPPNNNLPPPLESGDNLPLPPTNLPPPRNPAVVLPPPKQGLPKTALPPPKKAPPKLIPKLPPTLAARKVPGQQPLDSPHGVSTPHTPTVHTPHTPSLQTPTTNAALQHSQSGSAMLPSALPMTNKRKTEVLADDYGAEEDDFNLDDLDDAAILQDIVDLENFELDMDKLLVPEANDDIFGDLDSMQNFLDDVAGGMEDLDLTFDLDLDKVVLSF
jgi:hypothetical protein